MHQQAFDFVKMMLWAIDPRPRRVCELGSRNVNGSVRPLFVWSPEYVGVDALAGPGVDVVCNAAVHGESNSFDLIVSTEMLEHAANAEAIIRNAHRLLTVGGCLILTAATEPRAPHSAIDGNRLREGEHYGNIDPLALKRWLGDFTASLVFTHHPGDVHAWAIK